MARPPRVLPLTAFLLALLVPLACGDDDDAASTGTTLASARTTTTVAGDSTTTGATAITNPPITNPPSTTTAATGTLIEITVAEGKVEGGGRKQVDKDEPVTLRVTSDVADEVHVHGYDLSLDLEAGEPAELTFTPNAAGVFEVELEERGLQLIELEVR
jgi:heme/copper-type cytochrome/quinol oxidase subunit 2